MARTKRWTWIEINSGVAEVRISSWRYFGDFVYQEMLDYDTYIWRGQRCDDWKLEPTLDRLVRDAKVGIMEKPQLVSPTPGERGMTPLMNHCWSCYPGGVKRELKSGADPNVQDSNGYTALMWLCRMYDRHFRARKRMFRSLLKHGASVEIVDTAGKDVLFYARDLSEHRFRDFVRCEVKRISRTKVREDA